MSGSPPSDAPDCITFSYDMLQTDTTRLRCVPHVSFTSFLYPSEYRSSRSLRADFCRGDSRGPISTSMAPWVMQSIHEGRQDISALGASQKEEESNAATAWCPISVAGLIKEPETSLFLYKNSTKISSTGYEKRRQRSYPPIWTAYWMRVLRSLRHIGYSSLRSVSPRTLLSGRYKT